MPATAASISPFQKSLHSRLKPGSRALVGDMLTGTLTPTVLLQVDDTYISARVVYKEGAAELYFDRALGHISCGGGFSLIVASSLATRELHLVTEYSALVPKLLDPDTLLVKQLLRTATSQDIATLKRFHLLTFELWMRAVNAAILNVVGMTSEDLPDYEYHDAFDNNETPRQCAEMMLEAQGWNGENA